MTRDGYEVRRYRQSDREKLFQVLRGVWGDGFTEMMARIWDWKYEQNPHNLSGGHNSMVLTCEGEPVGFLGMLSANIKVGDRVVPIAWGSELSVHPDHLGQGYLVIKNIGDDAEKMIAGTAKTRDLALLPLGFGAFDITRLISHKLVLAPRRFLTSHFDNGALGMLGAAAMSIPTVMAKLVMRGRIDRQVTIGKVTGFGPEFDEFWARVSPDYELIPVRDRAFLNWRFRDCPNRDYTVLAAFEGNPGGGRVAGYVVLRIEDDDRGLRRGFLVDILAPRHGRAVQNRLLAEAEDFFRQEGADMVTCTISQHDREYRKMLQRNGYLFRSPRAWITGHCGCNKANDYLREHFEHSDSLLMTRADTDLDYNY